MTSWEKIKADPVKLQKHNEKSKIYAKNKYETDPEYKEKNTHTNECIYVGHCEIIDYETGFKAKSRPKVGKSRYLTALNRGRSQGGCDWIFDYIYFVPKEKNYSELETLIHKELNIKLLQQQ